MISIVNWFGTPGNGFFKWNVSKKGIHIKATRTINTVLFHNFLGKQESHLVSHPTIIDSLPSIRSSREHVNQFNIDSSKSEYFNLFNNLFHNTSLKLTSPAQRDTFNINDSVRIKLLRKSRLGFSHLREHKFRHGFRDILSYLCLCSIETETKPR